MTLRLRLTLLYGLVFIAAGAGLLAVTYGLFKHNQASSEETLGIRGIQFTLPAGATVRAFRAAGVVQRSVAPAPSGHVSTSGNVHTTTSSGGAASGSGFVT